MKKTLLSLLLLSSFGVMKAQTVYSFGFDGTTSGLATAGWVRTNQSTSPNATALWTIPTYVPVVVNLDALPPVQGNAFNDIVYTTGQTSPVPNGQAGGANSFALVNFQSTTGGGTSTISNWLISPNISVQDGDVVSFWSRKGTAGTTDYPDRLELRMSTAAATVTPAGGPTDLGSFTALATSVNPTLVAGFVYPKVWTKYSYTVAGVGSTPVAVKFGFRYFVTNGGPSGANSDIIGIDTFSVDRTLSTSDFFAKNFSMYPNPANGIVNLSSKNNTAINSVQVTDLNGRVVKSFEANGVSETQINVSDLTTGMYFVNVKTGAGSGSIKLMKN